MGFTPIITVGSYTLLQSETQYVVATNYDPKQPEGSQWDSGTYVTHWNESEAKKIEALYKALECMRTKTEIGFIRRSRLVELATMLVDGLLKDDEDSAHEYFDSVCVMSEEEKEYLGVTENQNNVGDGVCCEL